MKHNRNGEEACAPCKQAYAENYRARKFWKQLWNGAEGVCPLCLRAIPFDSASVEVDHKTPKSRGGEETLSNLQVVHVRCNRLKWNRTDEEAREKIASMIASGEY